MLVEFRVKNFRSIKEEQILSMVASPLTEKSELGLIPTGIKSMPRLLKSAVLYGANASGKSNTILALSIFQDIVLLSAVATPAGKKFPVQPFLLDEDSRIAPAEFEITFIEEGIRYQYGFKLNQDRIIEEYLVAFDLSKKILKPQVWFTRKFLADANVDDYYLGPNLAGQKSVWKDTTKSTTLFLSNAVNLNSEQLLPVYKWITQKLVVFVNGEVTEDYTIECLSNRERANFILQLMRDADTGIEDIKLAKGQKHVKKFAIDPISNESKVHEEKSEISVPIFLRGNQPFRFEDESLGTQKLFSLAGPIIDILVEGRILVADEMNSSLHSLLMEQIVWLFNEQETNQNNAQLIFTTHDTSLLNTPVFRRDQIWFVEKDSSQATKLFPLTDFSPRKNEALEKGYLSGRYGAIPLLRDFTFGGKNATK